MRSSFHIRFSFDSNSRASEKKCRQTLIHFYFHVDWFEWVLQLLFNDMHIAFHSNIYTQLNWTNKLLSLDSPVMNPKNKNKFYSNRSTCATSMHWRNRDSHSPSLLQPMEHRMERYDVAWTQTISPHQRPLKRISLVWKTHLDSVSFNTHGILKMSKSEIDCR